MLQIVALRTFCCGIRGEFILFQLFQFEANVAFANYFWNEMSAKRGYKGGGSLCKRCSNFANCALPPVRVRLISSPFLLTMQNCCKWKGNVICDFSIICAERVHSCDVCSKVYWWYGMVYIPVMAWFYHQIWLLYIYIFFPAIDN